MSYRDEYRDRLNEINRVRLSYLESTRASFRQMTFMERALVMQTVKSYESTAKLVNKLSGECRTTI